MRGRRTVTFNSSSLPRIVNVQPISPVFVSRMERPAYWTCWTRRELNCRPKMLTRKAIPTAPSLPSYCTNRLLAAGRKLFLQLREAEDPETYALFNEESNGFPPHAPWKSLRDYPIPTASTAGIFQGARTRETESEVFKPQRGCNGGPWSNRESACFPAGRLGDVQSSCSRKPSLLQTAAVSNLSMRCKAK
jgi:hypothetical protein